MSKQERILVVRYRFIGDTLLTVPFLRNLRRNYPDAVIDMLVAPVSGDVIKNCPYVDNFIYFDTTKKHRYENTKEEKKSFWSYVKLLRENKYTKAYVLKRSFSSALLVFLAGIKKRIGFNTEGRGFLLTKRVKYVQNRHEVDCFLDVLKADNLEVYDNYLENWVDEAALRKVAGMFSSNKKKVIIHATSGNEKKQWNLKNFAQVVEYLSNEKDAEIIYCGSRSDKGVYDKIHFFIKNPLKNEPANFCGLLNLQESLAVISNADLIIGCDSGNLHMAASLRVKVLGLFGPMSIKKWKPQGKNNVCLQVDLPCCPCNLKKKCKRNYECLSSITPQMVIENIDKMIGE